MLIAPIFLCFIKSLGVVVKKIIFDFDFNRACIGEPQFNKLISSLVPEIKKIKGALAEEYKTDYAFLNLLSDKQLSKTINRLINSKRVLDPKILVVIGIGGSDLGTVAIHEALNGLLYNEKNPPVKVYFVDTLDSDYLSDIIHLVENNLKEGENVLVNVVTKSGATTETIANYEIFLDLVKKYKGENYRDYIVITTDNSSKFCGYAKKNHIECLDVPKKVGGRYSVFSAVGLFPLGFLGIDIEKLLEGARFILKDCLSESVDENPAALSAAIIFYHYNRGINIHDTFIFSKNVRSFGAWYRQLVGESLGKKYNKKGDLVEVGITPTVSVGPADLHSVAQLYLGGPRDKFTTFITVKNKSNILLPKIDIFEEFVENIQGRPVSFIMRAIVEGVMAAYQEDDRPFVSVHIPQKSEFCVGQLLQWKMLEIVYLGDLFGINPFDQPQVELYKKETREILKR